MAGEISAGSEVSAFAPGSSLRRLDPAMWAYATLLSVKE
jgi:hypothetical protein